MAILTNFRGDATTTLTTIYTCPAGKTCMLFQVRATNIHATDQADFDCTSGIGGTDTYIDKDIPVPRQSHYDTVVSTDKFILAENEVLKIRASIDSHLEVTGSVVEI